MNNINSIAFDSRKYETQDEFWADVTMIMKTLVNQEYTVSIRYEDCGIYIVEYDYTDQEMANFIPWVTADDYETYLEWKCNRKRLKDAAEVE